MAFQQLITLSNGATGNYARIVVAHLDYMVNQAVFTFSLYQTRDNRLAAPASPLVPVYTVMRLSDPQFTQYFSFANMSGMDHVSQGYLAARTQLPVYGTTGQLFGGAVNVFESGQPVD